MPTIEEQQAQQNIQKTFEAQRAARAAQFQSDQNKAQVDASSANRNFQNQDLLTRQAILKSNTPGVIDRNNTVVGGDTVKPIGATGGQTVTTGTTGIVTPTTPGMAAPTSTGAMTGTPTTTSGTPGIPAATDKTPGILSYEELSQDMRTYLDNNPLAKSQFDLVGKQGQQQQAQFLKDAEKAVIESKNQRDYASSQAANAQAQRDIQFQQNFRQGASAINKAEQNMYYSAVSPVTSGSQQTAAHNQIRDMARQIDDIVAQYGLQNDAYAAQTAENARRIVLDLDNKLGETLNKKLQEIDNGVKNGEIATPEQLDRIFKENSEAILKEVPQLTNFAVQQMSDLTTNFMNTQKELRARQDVFNQNKNTYNEQMSQVQGFAVDGNGNPILDSAGKQIEIPKESPIKPTFDEKTGQLVTFGLDEYGNITAKATQVQGFRPEKQKPNIIETKEGLYNVDTGKWLQGPQNNAPIPVNSSVVQSAITECRANGQCGEGVNDYLQQLGLPRLFGDSYESKVANINSDTPTVGSIAIWNPSQTSGKNYGHVAIVLGKGDKEGTIKVHDWNWDNKGSQLTHDVPEKEISSQGGYYVPQQKKAEVMTDSQRVAANQAISQFRSNPEVKAYENALSQSKGLITSLEAGNPVGDVGAVYQFMKSLDPQSTVREGELQLAMSATGLGDKIKNTWERVVGGQKLTVEQKKEMGMLAKEYIKAMGSTYDRLYDDMTRFMDAAGVPESVRPTRATLSLQKNNAPDIYSTVQAKIYELAKTMTPQQIVDLMKQSANTKDLDFSKFNFKLQ